MMRNHDKDKEEKTTALKSSIQEEEDDEEELTDSEMDDIAVLTRR